MSWLRLAGFVALAIAGLWERSWTKMGHGAVAIALLVLGAIAMTLTEAVRSLDGRSSTNPALLEWTGALVGYGATASVLAVAGRAVQVSGAAFLMYQAVSRTLGPHRDERASIEVTALWIALGFGWLLRDNDTPLLAMVVLGVLGASLAIVVRRVSFSHPAERSEPAPAPVEADSEPSSWAEHDSMLHDLSNAMTASLFIVRDLTRCLDKRTEPGLGRAKGLAQALSRELSEIGEHIRSTRRNGRLQPVESETLNLLGPVERCVEIVSRLHPHVACRVESEPSTYEPVVSINGGESTLKRIVENLLLNACQAQINGAKPDPSVVCRVSITESSVTLSVEDEGPGFPDVILSAFPGPTRSTKPQGTGVGLHSCHQLVVRDGGNLTLSNLGNGGAKVVIAWPRVNRDVSRGAKSSQVAISGTRPRHEPVLAQETLVVEKR